MQLWNIMPLIVYCTSLLLHVLPFCLEGEAAAVFDSKPSEPSGVQEFHNITLVWTYTLGGGIGSASFSNVTGPGSSVGIAQKFGSGNTNVAPSFQERFRADISVSQAWLTILTMQRSDQGVYRFRMEDDNFGILEDDVNVVVKYPAVITHISGNQTVNESDTVNLTSTADGTPEPNITWTRLSDNSVVTFPLTITGKQNEGGYRCTADNGVGSPDKRTVFIFVENFHPINTQLSTNLTNNTLVVNEGIKLTCSAQANPLAEYRLYREQESLFNSTVAGSSATYTTSVSEEINQVLFSCTPLNYYGDGPTDTVNVTVLHPAAIDYASPSQSVVEGNGVDLFCNASGNPPPSIAWSKQESNTVLSSSETLTLSNLTRGDNGAVYKCKVENKLGSDEANVTITVLSPPTVTIQQCSTPVSEGNNATLYCNATGNPVPNTAWIKGGEVVTYHKRLVIANISRDQHGSYECLAWNGVGNNDTENCTVDVQYPPKLSIKPSSQDVVEGNGVTLFGNATGNPQPNISWTKQGNNVVLSSSETLTLSNLTRGDNGTVYKCKVQNNLGSDEAKAAITVLYPPSVTIQQCSTPVTEGDNATLYCNATGNPMPNTAWIKAGEVVTYNKRLVIANISRDQGGSYECLAWNGVGNNDTKNCTLNVQYPPKFIFIPNSQHVVESNEVTLFGNATGNPPPSISWTKQGSNTVLSSSETLTLTNLTREDNGSVYKCKVQNNLGSDEANVTITVLYPPSVTIQQCSTPVTEGDNATLYCHATGNPVPNTAWIKAGEVVTYNKRFVIANISRDQGGSYECLAWNGVGNNDTKNCTLNVQYPPKFIFKPFSQQVVESNEVTLFGNATGNPLPSISWTKQGSNTVLSSSETLTLTNMTREDNGVAFKCKVQNNLGSDEANLTITVLFGPSVRFQQCSTPVNERDSATLYCNATGNPAPNITWIKAGTGQVVPSNEMLVIANILRTDAGNYKCLASNGIGKNDTKSCTIDVYFPAEIDSGPSVQQVVEGNGVTLFCNATGNPRPNITWTKEGSNSVLSKAESLTLTNLTRKQNGSVYTCKVKNSLGPAKEGSAMITVLVPPSAMIQQCLSPVTEGANATLYCNATGNPAPSMVWIRGSTGLVVSSNNMLTIEAIKRNESGSYKCRAWNGIGKNSTTSCTVDVHYPPVITKPQSRIHLINASESVTIKCLAEANPNATYAWKRATEVVSNDEYLHLNDVNDGHGGNYTCTATNSLNSASLTILVKVTRREIAVEVTVENEEYLSDYDDLNSAASKEFVRKFEEQVKKKCPTTLPACTIKVTRLRKGSVIVSFTLFFTTPVTTSEGLAELRAAVNNGRIGPYTVTSLKIIKQAEPTTTPSASTTGTVTTEKKSTSRPDGPPWVIIGAVIGGVVVFAVIVAIVTWCVHKKRKCRGKGIKIRHSESWEQQAFSRQKGQFGAEDNAYAQVNHNYVGTGPPSANGFEALALKQRASAGRSDAAAHQQAAAAPPTCAVVKKSKNKKKKGEEKLGHTDAEVDKSKKTAKKSKPEEIIYADLEDMNVPWTPTFSTFLGPLPPIKRPEPYENTQYADITQFLKSDATLPESDSNQGTELQPQVANKDEGGAEGEDRNTPM